MKTVAKRSELKLSLPPRARPYVMAHRGNMTHEPENTLCAFRRALNEGADILETDIHFSADGVPVCIHDPTLDRTTNGRGRVNLLTAAELRTLRALDHAGEPTEERIPTLAEFLAIVPAGHGVALEIKADQVADPALAGVIVRLIQSAAMEARAIVLSFKREHLRAMQQAAPWLPAGLITMRNLSPFHPFQMLGPHPKILYLNRFYIRLAHAGGKAVCPLDPWPEKRIGWYLRSGVDALLSNDPAATIAALKSNAA